MNYLIAKLKGNGNNFLKVIASKNDILEMPDLTNIQNYTPEYKLEDDEWFKLDNFLSKNYKNGLIEQPFNGTSLNQITVDKYEDIKYLCSKQNSLFLFQKMSLSSKLRIYHRRCIWNI